MVDDLKAVAFEDALQHTASIGGSTSENDGLCLGFFETSHLPSVQTKK
jgi:hypothetical protein